MSAAPMIEARGVHKYFGGVHVLRGIDVSLAHGEVGALMGSSGSGKSTFLRCLNRIEEPSEGQVLINGTVITDQRTDVNRVRADIGMVFQDYNLFPHMTALENVSLGLIHVRKRPRSEAKDAAASALEQVGLANHLTNVLLVLHDALDHTWMPFHCPRCHIVRVERHRQLCWAAVE